MKSKPHWRVPLFFARAELYRNKRSICFYVFDLVECSIERFAWYLRRIL